MAIQNISISLYGYYWNWRRFGGGFLKAVGNFKEREFWSTNQWQSYQQVKLYGLLNHAVTNVPYYKRKLNEISIGHIHEINMFDLLASLPFLEKEDLRIYGTNELLSLNKKKGSFYSSSGSTGTPTRIYYSYKFHRLWSALFEARIRHWAGLNRYVPRGMIGGRRILPEAESRRPFYRYNAAEKQVYFSAYHIAPNHVADYVEGMFRYGVKYMTGYAASNYILARMIDKAGIKAPKMSAVITSSEKLTPEMRETFQKVYKCRTYDSYSGVEACGLISECEHGGLHISPDSAIIEILNAQGQPVHPGETGEAVCTGLLNFDQPLIRYKIGDRLTLAKNQQCPCGRNMPLISEINGRVEDVLKGPDGREMVRFHGIFVDLPEVRRGQIVQERLDQFIVNVECSGNLNKSSEKILINRLRSQLGAVSVEVNQIDKIPIGPNGKFKAVISNLK